MKEFEIACPLGSEPKLRDIESRAGGPQVRTILVKRSLDSRKEPLWRYRYEAYAPGEEYVPYSLPE